MQKQKSQRNGGTTLACFSPPIMLATFAIEIVLALYVLWRYKLDRVTRLVIALLCFLALFQLSEYFVCGGLGMTSEGWGKLGYVVITILPPLGLHLLYTLAGKKVGVVVTIAYASMFGMICWLLGYDRAFSGYVCTGNYVIFQLASHISYVYGTYYYGWLLTVIVLALKWSGKLAKRAQRTKKIAQQRRNMLALVVGYLVFLVPTALANTIAPVTRQGIPSVMCGFAVLFAFILIGYIVPNATRTRITLSRKR